jgi:hypothetical protein
VRRVKPQKRTPKSAQLASRAPLRAATEGSRDEELKGNSDQASVYVIAIVRAARWCTLPEIEQVDNRPQRWADQLDPAPPAGIERPALRLYWHQRSELGFQLV